MMLLSRKQRENIREITRQTWIECEGDPERTRTLSMERVKQNYSSIIGAILLALAVKAIAWFIFELIKYWLSQGIPEHRRFYIPPAAYAAGEPGF